MRLPLRLSVVPLVCLLLCGSGQLLHRAPQISHVEIFNALRHSYFSLKSLRGRVVLIVFWNQNDAGFEKFIALLKTWYGRYRLRGLEIAAIYIPWWESENAKNKLSDLIQEYAMEFPVMEDKDGRVRAAYDTLVSPSIFCVDRKGYLRGEYLGIFDMNRVRVMLETLLEEAP